MTSDMWQNQFINSQTFQEVISKTTSLNVPNPLKQNYSDIEYFNTLVPFEYESIALFSDDLEIKVTGRNVLRESEFSLYLSKIEEKPVDTKLICYLLMIENAID